MIDIVTDTLQPVIVQLLLTMVLAVIGWLMRFLPAKMQIEIEAKHRAALHSALNTGVGYALDALETAMRLNPAVAVGDAAVSRVLDYVERSVPDAIKRLGPSREMLQDMARSKLNEALAAAGVDPLTNALRDAGAPVAALHIGGEASHQ